MTRIAYLSKGAVLLTCAALVGACATIEETAVQALAETHHATLTGAQVSAGGDADGYATADLTVADDIDQICYDINDIRNLGTITGAHIHRGAAGTNGPPVLTLTQADEGGWKNCVERGEWRQEDFENNPAAFYAQIHTTQYPNGAIRGQFRRD